MTQEARERRNNSLLIKVSTLALVKPQKAEQIENHIISVYLN
jgi:DNA-binding TFAR19-related protein (PDSD5 family)